MESGAHSNGTPNPLTGRVLLLVTATCTNFLLGMPENPSSSFWGASGVCSLQVAVDYQIGFTCGNLACPIFVLSHRIICRITTNTILVIQLSNHCVLLLPSSTTLQESKECDLNCKRSRRMTFHVIMIGYSQSQSPASPVCEQVSG